MIYLIDSSKYIIKFNYRAIHILSYKRLIGSTFLIMCLHIFSWLYLLSLDLKFSLTFICISDGQPSTRNNWFNINIIRKCTMCSSNNESEVPPKKLKSKNWFNTVYPCLIRYKWVNIIVKLNTYHAHRVMITWSFITGNRIAMRNKLSDKAIGIYLWQQ